MKNKAIKKIEKQPNQCSIEIYNFKPFKYFQITQYRQFKHSIAMSLNNTSSLLLASNDEKIKLFGFFCCNGQLKLIIFWEFNDLILCARFMNNNSQFVSISDQFITIWDYDKSQSWHILKTLSGHQNNINCLQVNFNDDLIISGSDDKSIKFWSQFYDWKCTQTIENHQNCVLDLSLCENGDKLISLDNYCLILVVQKNLDNFWSVIQKISIEYGHRLCFITNTQFVYLPTYQDYLDIFEFNNDLNKFQISSKNKIAITKENDFWYFFPPYYCKKKGILMQKQGKSINFIKLSQQQQENNHNLLKFENISYQHKFENSCIFGTLREDGEYLITWDGGDSLEDEKIGSFNLKVFRFRG